MRQICTSRRIAAFTLLLALGAGAVLYLWRASFMTTYYLKCLASAADMERGSWIERIAAQESESFSTLTNALKDEDSPPARGAVLAIHALTQRWGHDDPKTAELGSLLAQRFPSLSRAGQLAALDLARRILESAPPGEMPPALMQPFAKILTRAAQCKDPLVQRSALVLVEEHQAHARQLEVLVPMCDLVRACLQDGASSNRLHALRLAPRMTRELALEAAALLNDPSPDMRRAALLALAADADVIGTDDLLRWLHDSDVEVRGLCEQALRGRGLSEAHIKLGRLLTSARPDLRLQVLDQLRRMKDLDAGIWLRRLSHDESPAVRAAALRAAVDETEIDLSDRIEQMTQNDPSSTVRQLAQYYIKSRKANQVLTFGRP